tara:strand:+ start:573 stop:869 length:297 start_codon:yes stop_codon:yes gene_type:complete
MTVHPNIDEYLADPNSVSADIKGALDAIGPWLLRKKRDQLLVETDIKALPDSPMTDSKRDEWKIYRQALRDLPANSTPKITNEEQLDESSVTWPTQPS